MKTPKRLFRVTLDWNSNDREEGDYCTTVWAKDADDAILATAILMTEDRTDDTRAERKAFINGLVDAAGPYAAVDVAAGLQDTLRELLAGPRNVMSKATGEAYTDIITLLVKQGVLRTTT